VLHSLAVRSAAVCTVVRACVHTVSVRSSIRMTRQSAVATVAIVADAATATVDVTVAANCCCYCEY
jgi:hypothetical protein